MHKFLATIAVVSMCVGVCVATYGCDISQPTSEASFRCLRGDGFDFAVVRAGMSTGQPDPNAPASVANAWAAGMAHVDVYIFPCPTCGNPGGQVANMLNNLANHGTNFGMVWFDIEGPQYWTSSQADNQAFFNGMVAEARARGVHIGVYTSESQWIPIMGNWGGGSSFPLWYAHYDGNPNFGDFSPFAGWSKPAIKQYAGTTSICSAGIDKDWYPD